MECDVPLRNFVDKDLAPPFISKCASLNFMKTLGFCLTLGAGLLIAHFVTQNQYDKAEQNMKKYIFVVPMWTSLLPIAYVAYYYMVQYPQYLMEWEKQRIKFLSSGKKKDDFLTAMEADERQNGASLKGLVGTSVLAASNFLGPYLRGY